MGRRRRLALFRADYDRFPNVAQRHLPNGVAVEHYALNPDYQDYTMKLVNRNAVYVTERQNGLFRQNAWIDVFPLDGLLIRIELSGE